MRSFSRSAAAAALALSLEAGRADAEPVGPGVGPQYGTTHVYVAPADLEPFVKSFVATFGGEASKPQTTTVTPTPSQTTFVAVGTPVGRLSVFAFAGPVPYPFGPERTGYLVTDMDSAVAAATAAGADVVVAPFADPIGRDAVIQWPGGVDMQLYWHTKSSLLPPLATVPENRVYVSPQRVDAFVDSFIRFSKGRVVSDDAQAAGVEIGRPDESYRRVRLASDFGDLAIMATDGHLPFPYGREMTGYAVKDLGETLKRAESAGASVLVQPFESAGRQSAMVAFPGGYIAEIHSGE